MKDVIKSPQMDAGIQEMTSDEIDLVSGGDLATAAKIGVAVGAIGTAAFGTGWGALAVGAAFAGAPIAVLAMAGLAAYGGYSVLNKMMIPKVVSE